MPAIPAHIRKDLQARAVRRPRRGTQAHGDSLMQRGRRIRRKRVWTRLCVIPNQFRRAMQAQNFASARKDALSGGLWHE